MSETAIDASAKRTQRRVAFGRVARLVVGESCSATPMLGGEGWLVDCDLAESDDGGRGGDGEKSPEKKGFFTDSGYDGGEVSDFALNGDLSKRPAVAPAAAIVLMDSEAIRKQHGHTLLDCRSQNAPAAAMMRAGPGRGGVDSRGGAVE